MNSSQNDHIREEDFSTNLNSYHYQVDLLMLFAWRGYKNNYDFQLETESKSAQKFDDVVFSYQYDGKTYVSYLQAKHSKKETNRWNYQDFAADRNIAIGNLKKYYTSFCKIKQKFGHQIGENFMLCSNIAFDSLKLKNVKNSEDDFLEFVETTSYLEFVRNRRNIKKDIFGDFQNNVQWRTYKIAKLSSEINEKLLKITNLSILSEEFANCINNPRKTTETNTIELNMENFWFSKYHKALENDKVIEKNQEVIRFSSWFLTKKPIKAEGIILTDENVELDWLDFRSMFKNEYEKQTSMPMNNIIFNKDNIIHQYFIKSVKCGSEKLQVSSRATLQQLIASFVKYTLEETSELDETFKQNFGIFNKILTKTKRTAFTENFIYAEIGDKNVSKLRKLLFHNLEKNAAAKLEFEVFLITENFYQKFESRLELENKMVINCAEKLAERLVFKKTLTDELISTESITLLKNVLECVDTYHVKLKSNFLKNQNLTEEIENFRVKFFDSYLRKLLAAKEIVYKFNVAEVDALLSHLHELQNNKDKCVPLDGNPIKEETQNLINSFSGFVFEEVAEKSNTVKLMDIFITRDDLPDDIKQMKAKLKKKFNFKDFKGIQFEISDFHSCSTSLNESENLVENIKDFCQKFIIVTSPDEKGVVSCIQDDLERRYNSQVANYATNKLRDEIFAFAKKKENRYLTDQSIAQLFDNIVIETKIYETAVITSQFCDKLKSYNIQFKEEHCQSLIEFGTYKGNRNTDSVKKQILRLKSEQPLLTAIKVAQALEKHERYQNKIIFCSATSLINSTMSSLSAFNSDNIQMLVIFDDEVVPDESFCNEIFAILQTNILKQVIIITCEESTFDKYFITCFEAVCNIVNFGSVFKAHETKNDSTFFYHLTADTQYSLKKRKIKIKGEEILLEKLINDNGFYEILNGNALMEILTSNNIEVLKTLQPHSQKKDEYYIERCVNFYEVNDKIFEEEKLKNHFFAIEGAARNDVMKFLYDKNVKLENMGNLGQFEENLPRPKFIILSSREAKIEFMKICDRCSESLMKISSYYVHWLRLHNGKLIWLQSSNSETSTVSRSILSKLNISKTSKIEEKDIFEYISANHITLICDTAGMGKTTILNSLSEKNKNQHVWPVRIDLNEYTKCLLDIQSEPNNYPKFSFNFSCDKSENYAELILRTFGQNNRCLYNSTTFIEFLSEFVISKSKMIFENYIFLYFFSCGKLLIIFDGFDEISPTYSNVILEILKNLSKESKNQVLITSRPNCQETLESNLDTSTFTLQPFSEADQLEYLTNVWKQQWNGDLSDIMEKGIKEYSLQLIHLFQKFVGEDCDSYMGVPLKMKMIAEIFRENEECHKDGQWLGCFDYLKALETCSEVDSKLANQNMNLFELYDTFTKKKFHRFLYEKLEADFTKNYGWKLKEIFCNYQHDVHKVIGFQQLIHEHKNDLSNEIEHLINEKTKNVLNKWITDFKYGIENVGIVQKFVGDRPIFDHLTYAEYFCACYIGEQLISENVEHVFKVLNIILKSYFPVFQYCIKHLMEHHIDCAKLEKVLNDLSVTSFSAKHGHFNCLKFFIDDEKLNNRFPSKDKFGKTLLHHAVEHHQLSIVIYIIYLAWVSYSIKSKKTYYTSLLEFFDVRDNNGRRVIDYASDSKTIFNILSDVRKSIEHFVLLNGEAVLLNDIANRSECIQNILQYATFDTIVHFLHNLPPSHIFHTSNWVSPNFFDDVAARNDFTEHQKHQMFEILWERSPTDERKELIANRILSTTVENECAKLFEMFFNFLEKQNCNISQDLIYQYMRLACSFQNILIVDFLFQKLNKCNYSMKLITEDKGSLKILEKFVKKNKLNVAEKDAKEKTIVLAAVQKNCKPGIIKYLVQNGADINAADIYGYSAVKWSLGINDDDIIVLFANANKIGGPLSYIIKNYYDDKIFDINEINNGTSRLHDSVINKDFNTALFLLQKEANVNITNCDDKTPLHYACEFDQYDMAELLLKYGAMYDQLDKNRKEPVDYCSTNSKIVDILNKIKTSFANVPQNASIFEKVSVKFDFPINASNKENKTIWHIAAESGHIDVIKELPCYDLAVIKINQKDANGNTPLHLASINGYKDIVLKLLKYGAFYNVTNKRNESVQRVADIAGHHEIVGLLEKIDDIFHAVKVKSLNASEDNLNFFKNILKFKDYSGKTLLHYAVTLKNIETTQMLLNRMADINCRDRDNHTPVYYAIENDDFAMLLLLIKNEARFYKDEFKEMQETQCTAFFKKWSELIRHVYDENDNELIKSIHRISTDKNLNSILFTHDHCDKNLLDYAFEMKNYDFVVQLLEKGATVDKYKHCENKKILRLLKFAFSVFKRIEEGKCDSTSMIKLIEHHGYQKVLTNFQLRKYRHHRGSPLKSYRGRTLLNCAAVAGNLEIVKWCINNGADCFKKDLDDLNAFDAARLNKDNNNEVLRFLKETFPESS